MVRRSIGDWYADAEGRGSDGPGFDWENDDRPDRTRDTWLDRLGPERGALPAQQNRPSKQNQPIDRKASSSRKPRPTSGRAARSPKPPPHKVAMAAFALFRNDQHLSHSAVAIRLQQRGGGWKAVTAADVREALTRKGSPARRKQSPPASTGGGKQRDWTRRNRSSNNPARPAASPHTIAMIAHNLRAAQSRRLGADEIAQYMRLQGWSTVTSADVRNALALTGPGPDTGRRPATSVAGSGTGKQRRKTGASVPSPGLSIYKPSMRDIATAAREIRAAHPDLTDSALAQRLRHRGVGWSIVTRDDVRRALQTATPEQRGDKSPAPALTINRTGKKRGRRRPSTPSNAHAIVTLPVAAKPVSRSDLCPACGVAVSFLGTCRCS